MKTMAFGLLAVAVLMISVFCLYSKKPVFGIGCGAAAIMLTCLTGHFWKEMLIESGKDTALLGWSRYPAAPMILAILLLTAVIVIILNSIRMIRQNKW